MASELFPSDLPTGQWQEFSAAGFALPVCGVVFNAGETSCGLPLGGIGTGCLDLNTDGTLGRCSIFNTFVPHRELNRPFLALAVGEQVWTLASRPIAGTESPAGIRYWGHYPIADLEFAIGGPVDVGLRAWSCLLPGDAPASNTPGIVFEFRIRNRTRQEQRGSLVFSFPGPDVAEAGGPVVHTAVQGAMRGAAIRCPNGEFIVATPDAVPVRTGGALAEPEDWRHCGKRLPPMAGSGAALALDFSLAADSEAAVSIVLAWYYPRWVGNDAHHYRHAYARQFAGAREAAEALAGSRGPLLARILRWQAVIYAAADLPPWLRDQLVNVLHTITEDAFWAADSIPPEVWYGPTGLFGLTESPRTTPHVCNPSDWYGALPIVFFFPELMAALLRSYAHFQLPNGEIPLGIGEGADLARPTYHVLHTLNSCVHIHLIDRLWRRDGDMAVLREFYPSARQALAFMQTLDRNVDGLPDLEPDPLPNQFYGAWRWVGSATHVNGFWLAALAMMNRMAVAMGDAATVRHCAMWQSAAAQSQEKHWDGVSYLLYSDPASGQKSETVLANQLAGEWCARLHGLPGAFPPERVQTALATIERLCGGPEIAGLLNAARRDGGLDRSGHPQSDGIFTGECLCAAATMAYAGRRESALDVARRLFEAVVLQDRLGWELPNLLDPQGLAIHGTDFYQNMILWALPLALQGADIAEACAPNQWIARILTAASAAGAEPIDAGA